MWSGPWRNPDRIAAVLLVVSVTIRFFLTWSRRFNADEFQHVHASWMLQQGYRIYTDFWENHSPLLYFLTAPLLSFFGEGVSTVFLLRFFHSAAGLGIAAITYKIARLNFDKTTSLLGILVLSFSEIYLQKTIEIRTDQFLVLCWMTSLLFCLMVRTSGDNSRAFIAGIFLGIGMLFSPKALICYLPAAWILYRSKTKGLVKQLFFGSGFLLPVTITSLHFLSRGTLHPWLDSTIIQNLSYPDTEGPGFLLRPQNLGLMLLGLSGMVISNRFSERSNLTSSIMIAALFPAAVLIFLMPSTYSQSALMFIPIFSIYGGFALRSSLFWRHKPDAKRLLFLIFTLSTAFIIPITALVIRFSETNSKQIDLLRFVLRNTTAEESVFDGNTAYIFRKQAFFYGSLVEAIRERLKQGSQHSIIDSLKKNRCRVVLFDDRVADLPESFHTFLRNNYLPAEHESVWFAGKDLGPQDYAGNKAVFRIDIPVVYRIESTTGGNLKIDERPYTGPVLLEQGIHVLKSDKQIQGIRITADRTKELRTAEVERGWLD